MPAITWLPWRFCFLWCLPAVLRTIQPFPFNFVYGFWMSAFYAGILTFLLYTFFERQRLAGFLITCHSPSCLRVRPLQTTRFAAERERLPVPLLPERGLPPDLLRACGLAICRAYACGAYACAVRAVVL
jgi:hypothetical protein